jgi:hypothetical protein
MVKSTISISPFTHFLRQPQNFTRGCCFKCGSYSLFIVYETSYPIEFYCSSCIYKRNNIASYEYFECPECNVLSLLYDNELEGGICLNHRCANHRDGGILIDMQFCTYCETYKIEDICNCNRKENCVQNISNP